MCTGIKVAKTQIKFIAALFLLEFDYEAVDKNGRHLTKQSVPDYNLIHQVSQLNSPFFDLLKIFDRLVQQENLFSSGTRRNSMKRRAKKKRNMHCQIAKVPRYIQDLCYKRM
jgi:hypothetical protein